MDKLTKPAPEVIGDYIHVRVEDPAKFVKNSFRTIDIDEAKGIKAVIGKYIADPDGPTHVQKYLFDKEKWTVAEATAWVNDHKSSDESINKFMNFEIKEPDDVERSFWAVASTGEVDRDGDILEPEGWKLKNFKKNPVILWAHQYSTLPVARAIEIKIEDGKLLFKPQFMPAEINPFAESVYQAYKQGYIRAFSVGFIPIKFEDISEDEAEERGIQLRRGRRFQSQELLEISAVPVPSLPSALAQREMQTVMEKGFNQPQSAAPEKIEGEEKQEKGALPFKTGYGKEDEGASWDAGAETMQAEVADLKIMCAWVNSDEPDLKTSYKLPYRRAESKKLVWRAVAAAMGALFGARGGVNIPDSDRRAVYGVLSKAYKEFDKEPPEFRSYAEPELKRIFDYIWFDELGEIMNQEAVLREERALEAAQIKEGRVLSAKNRTLIKQCSDMLSELYQATEPSKDEPKQAEQPDNAEQYANLTKSIDAIIERLSS